jgi:hypothetical protein
LSIHNNVVHIAATLPVGGRDIQIEFGQTPGGNPESVFLKAGSVDGRISVFRTARSFAELLGDHPEDAAAYMIPLFEEFDLGVLYVGRDDAWRAFAARFKAEEKTRAAVLAILPKLNDDSAQIRDAAGADLAALGPGVVPILLSLDQGALPVQSRVSIRAILQPYVNNPNLKDPAFLTLCLAAGDPQIPALAKVELEKLGGKRLDFDPGASLADRQVAMVKHLAVLIVGVHTK